ncbi:prepilin-type N-terminal cleavage/methylation domain-containing protein [Bacillus carboniphilus]
MRMVRLNLNKQGGFTLVEMMLVLLVVSIISASSLLTV